MPWPWQLPPISPNPPTSAESPQIPPDPSESRRVSWSNLNEGGDDGGAGHSFAVPYLPHSVEHFSSLAVEHFVFTRRESASRLQNSPFLQLLAVPKTKTKRAFWTLITSLLSPSPSPAVPSRGGRTHINQHLSIKGSLIGNLVHVAAPNYFRIAPIHELVKFAPYSLRRNLAAGGP
jgi:hypothetical protein